jgi:hypothetical protein
MNEATASSEPVGGSVVVRLPPPSESGAANASPLDLNALGYVEHEFFFVGDAVSYTLTSERTSDGRWDVAEAGSAPFTSRLLVRRPTGQDRFSGVVLVEWLNVSGGVDGDPDWGYLSDEIVREGHAWVGVSAQVVGVMGSADSVAGLSGGLVSVDPTRYSALQHPGDSFSFDIFTKAGRAVMAGAGEHPLGPLEPTSIIAIGESQSGTFLSTYVNAVQGIAGVYDGVLIHSRGGSIPHLDTGDRTVDGEPIQIRTDLETPVLIFETETDMTVLGFAGARQDDIANVRTWEVAGTAHADSYLLDTVYGDVAQGIVGACNGLINDGPQHQVLRAALHHLVDWTRGGAPPPASPRIAVGRLRDGPSGFVVERDELGIAKGGIRTPAVDVPVSTLSGDPIPDSPGFCQLFGSTTPFEPGRLTEMYVNPAGYRERFNRSLDEAIDAGFVLRPEGETWRKVAADFTWSQPVVGDVPQ